MHDLKVDACMCIKKRGGAGGGGGGGSFKKFIFFLYIHEVLRCLLRVSLLYAWSVIKVFLYLF
jgi:hypothetical protein